MIKKIKNAIKDDRIVVYFQPIFDNETGKIKSYESLVRLIEKDGKVLSPYFFLDIAKKAKLYKQIAKIVIDKSCRAFTNSHHDFSLNFEIDDLLDKELVDFTLKTAQKYNVIKQLTFEILESESIEDIDSVIAFTNLVSKHGCKISIDDFGSGYSNFMHVLRLKADYLKIDGSLIKNIHQDNDAKIIVNSIVNFAKELGLKTVAEFIHCQEVQDEILRLGIDYSQGYLLGEPKPELIEEKEPAFI
jgi:EAL domain-containing protein (putative c-di-GMP-specific phosphodiesterase class I)